MDHTSRCNVSFWCVDVCTLWRLLSSERANATVRHSVTNNIADEMWSIYSHWATLREPKCKAERAAAAATSRISLLVNHITFIRFTNLLSFQRVSRIYCQIKLYLLLFTLICGASAFNTMPTHRRQHTMHCVTRAEEEEDDGRRAAAASSSSSSHVLRMLLCIEWWNMSFYPPTICSKQTSNTNIPQQTVCMHRMSAWFRDDAITSTERMYTLADNEVTSILICVLPRVYPFRMKFLEFFSHPMRLICFSSDELCTAPLAHFHPRNGDIVKWELLQLSIALMCCCWRLPRCHRIVDVFFCLFLSRFF